MSTSSSDWRQRETRFPGGRLRVWRIVLLVTVVALTTLLVWAGWPPPSHKMVFRQFSDPPRGLWPRIRHGMRVNPALDYPASLYAEYYKPCSGTLIGRDTILIAAHCLFDDGPTTIEGQWGVIQARCRKHPKHQNTPEYDIALCKTAEEIPIRGFEQIARPPFQLGQKASIQVTGWGETAKTRLGQWWVRIKFRLRRRGGSASSSPRRTSPWPEPSSAAGALRFA